MLRCSKNYVTPIYYQKVVFDWLFVRVLSLANLSVESSANHRAPFQTANQNEAYKTKNDLVIWMRSNGYVPQTIFPQSKMSFDHV